MSVSTFTDWHGRKRREMIKIGERILTRHLDDVDFYSNRSREEYRRECDFEELCIALAIVHLKAAGDWE